MGGKLLSVELDILTAELPSNADQAALKIDKLTSAFSDLKRITQGGVGLTAVADELSKLNGALSSLYANYKKINDFKKAYLTHKNLLNWRFLTKPSRNRLAPLVLQ